jgi:predicted RecA/RadA family phage recombinase
MANNAVQPGKVLDYVNTTDAAVRSGDVVVAGALLGVALVDIAIGATGSVSIDGVYAVPKVAGAAVGQGVAVVFKASSKAFTVGAPAAGDVTGAAAVAFDAAASAATVMHVKFTGVPGTVAAS